MNKKMEQFPAGNPNPVLSLKKDGTVIYSNKEGEPLLHEWGLRGGEKPLSSIVDLVQRVISRNSPEKMEVIVGNRVYLVVFHPLLEQECVNISGFDISDQTDLERKLRESAENLNEVQKMAHIGNWEWDIANDKAYWSDEMYLIFKRDPKKLAPSLKGYLSYIHPEDLDFYCKANDHTRKVCTSGLDFRIILANGEERTLHIKSDFIFNDENIPIRVKGIIQDITERKKIEDALIKTELVRKKEIHHRIKNNLQVISSLLDLQAEKFKDKKNIEDLKVIEAFKESQDRVISMALIHEELHNSRNSEVIDIFSYIKGLTDNLFLTYRLGNNDVNLDLDIERDIFFNMDVAVPLGLIINELVSNSLKYAFIDRDSGEIVIKLQRKENRECRIEGYENTTFILTFLDNGVGIPEYLEIKDLDSLGLQLVSTLIDQLEGELELKRDNGTEFIIRFAVQEECNRTSKTVLQLVDND